MISPRGLAHANDQRNDLNTKNSIIYALFIDLTLMKKRFYYFFPVLFE